MIRPQFIPMTGFVLLLVCAHVHGQDKQVTLTAVDIPVFAASVVLAGVPPLVGTELSYQGCNPCDADRVNRLDRSTIGMVHPRLAAVSDALVIALPLSLAAAQGVRTTGAHFVADLVVFAQSIAVTNALAQIAKFAVRRPRPYMYAADSSLRRGDSHDDVSFFSGHAATAFSAAVAGATLFGRRHPGHRATAWIWTGGMSVATAVAALRVVSGKHFLTDVFTGAVVGAAVGWLVPYAHLREKPVAAAVTPGSVSVVMRF